MLLHGARQTAPQLKATLSRLKIAVPLPSKKSRKREAMKRIAIVCAILRNWDPIDIQPGELGPLDEYDGYAPHIVSLVNSDCSAQDLAAHLNWIRCKAIGVDPAPIRDQEIAQEILKSLSHTA